MGAIIFFALVFVMFSGALFNRAYAIAALVCMFAVEQWGGLYVPQIAQNGTYFNIAVLALLITCWLRFTISDMQSSNFEFLIFRIRLLLILLLFYAVITTMWAPVGGLPTKRLLDSSYYLIAVLFIAPYLANNPPTFSRMLDAVYWFGGIIVLLFAYVPTFERRSVAATEFSDDVISLPLALASFGGIVAIVAVHRLKRAPLHIVWSLLIVGSAIFLQVKTGSRGQLFFTIVAIMISLPALRKRFDVKAGTMIILMGIISCLAVYIVVTTENALSVRLNEENLEDSVGTRTELSLLMIEAWSTSFFNIVLGLGSSASWSLLGVYPHNVPVQILSELGLVGIVIFTLVVFWIVQLAFSPQVKNNISDSTRRDSATLFGCWVFAFLLSLKQFGLLGSIDLFLYAVLFEKCVHVGYRKKAKTSRRKRTLRFGNSVSRRARSSRGAGLR